MSYDKARDIPTFQEMEQTLNGMKMFRFVLPKEERVKLVEIETELDRLANLIDDFYDLFGDRHWVFNDLLNADHIEEIISNNGGIDDAEIKLIAQYNDSDFLERAVMRCNGIPALRKRIGLVEKAKDDYLAGRYYSTALLLITVIDGFVNELETSHRGAHARTGEELSIYDSPISHHKGIESVQGVFLKKMSVTNTEPITELYRHGIIHGVAINFDNIVVGTKAWNMLLAFMDWATAKIKSELPKPPEKTLGEVLLRSNEIKNDLKLLKTWKPYILTKGNSSMLDDELYQVCKSFYDYWIAKNYGNMSDALTTMSKSGNIGSVPKMVRDQYVDHNLVSYEIEKINHRATGAAEIEMEVVLGDGVKRHAEIRWLYEDSNGEIGNSMKNDGSWKIVTWGTSFYL